MDKHEIARDTVTSMFIALFVLFCFYLIRALGRSMGMPSYPSELVPQWLVPSGRFTTHLAESILDTMTVYFLYLGLPMFLATILGSAFGVNQKMSRTIMGTLFLTYILYLSLIKYNPEYVPPIYMFGIALFRLILGIEYIFFWKSEGIGGLIQATAFVGATNLMLYASGFLLKVLGLG